MKEKASGAVRGLVGVCTYYLASGMQCVINGTVRGSVCTYDLAVYNIQHNIQYTVYGAVRGSVSVLIM